MNRQKVLCSFVVLVFVLCLAPRLASAADMSGSWHGRWESNKTGHQGPIHARFRQVDADTYRAVFRGRFALVIPFRYALPLNVQCTDGCNVYFSGQKSLGPFGKFNYQATANDRSFVATYRSRRDRGQFVLNRAN